MEYKLKSNAKDISECLYKSGFFTQDECDEKAEYIINNCPSILYQNIDEIVFENFLTKIPVELHKDGEVISFDVEKVFKLHHERIPLIVIIYCISMEYDNKTGMMYLHYLSRLN